MRQVDLFDDYLNNALTGQEKQDFENELASNPIIANAFNEHKKLVESLTAFDRRKALKATLGAIHEQEFGAGSKVIALESRGNFASRHGRAIAVAASTAVVAVLATLVLLSTGGYLLTRQSDQIVELGRELNGVKATTAGIVDGITRNRKPSVAYAPASLEGSAFALSNKGYVITSYHMVKDADSIFIRNKATERTLARMVASDPKLDIAILKVENAELVKTWQIPFSLKEKPCEVGEKIFTLGYPREEMVYGEGSLSSLSGYINDSAMYQISIPVNPGNSGGPLLDENGSVVGVVYGKVSGAEATGFAVKALEIMNVISTLPDSTRTELAMIRNKKNPLRNLKRTEQIKRINPYVFNVLVYK